MTRAALLLLTGSVFAAALFVLGAQDLGDPEGAARARLAREAEAEGRIALARWTARLAEAAPIAEPIGALVQWSEESTPWPAGLAEGSTTPYEPDEVERAVLAVARTRQNSGDVAGARTTLSRLLDEEASAESSRVGVNSAARLTALRLAAAENDTAAVRRYLEVFRALPFELTVDGTSARLAATLTAAPELELTERTALANEVGAALRTGELGLGAPRDRIVVDTAGARVALDPEHLALRTLLEERLPSAASGGWQATFAEGARTGAALRAALRAPETAEGRWRLYEVLGELTAPPGTRVAVRFGAPSSLALHAVSDLRRSFSAELSAPWALAEPSESDLDMFGPELDPFGSGQPERLMHPDPSASIAGEQRRLAVIRTALFGLGAALFLAALLGARAAQRAARLVELRRTFVASVSHDLRTPLASISGLAENLVDGVVEGVIGAPPSLREYHRAIAREAARLRRLVEGLLDFARLERGELPRIRPSAVDLAAWAEELVRAAADLCAPHGVSVEAALGPLPQEHTFDADAARRAVLNLVENAVRHSGSDTVSLTISCDRALVVRVADRGRGLAPGQGELFAPYVTRGATAGTGLGLSIVRALARAHGGTATLEPRTDGPGLIATLVLPDSEAAA